VRCSGCTYTVEVPTQLMTDCMTMAEAEKVASDKLDESPCGHNPYHRVSGVRAVAYFKPGLD
jgi:hypothetical protein